MPLPSRIAALAFALAAFPAAASASWSPNGDPICSASGQQFGIFSTSIPGCVVNPCAYPTFAAWSDDRDTGVPGSDLYYTLVDAGGAYGAPPGGTPLCTVAAGRSGLALAKSGAFGGPLGGTGGVIAAWVDLRSGAADIYARRIGSGGDWAAGGVPVCTVAGGQNEVSLATDGSAGAILAWVDGRAGGYAIYSQRLDAGGGALWAMDGIPVATTSAPRLGIAVAEDAAGGAYLAWTEWGASHREIRATRLTGTGAPAAGWPLAGVRVGTAGYEQVLTRLLPDGSGGALFVWSDPGSDPFRDFYALRVLADGTTASGWPAAGRAIGGPAQSWRTISDALEYGGGLLLAWREDSQWTDMFPQPPIDTDLHLQRLLANGSVAPGWADSGMVFCTGTGFRGGARLCPSGSGVIAAWDDDRAGDGQTDVYAVRVSESGTRDPAWSPNGNPVSAAAGAQSQPVPQSTGTNGAALVMWVDRRTGEADIYARLIGADGTVGVEPAGSTVSFTLSPPGPNPSRGAVRFALDLPRAGRLEADVIDPAGRRIARIASGTLGAGRHALEWNGASDSGAPARAGLYFVRVAFEGQRLARALVRLR